MSETVESKRGRFETDEATTSKGVVAGKIGGKSREKFTVVRTRPVNLETKVGDGGKKVNLSANYFKIQLNENFEIVLYHVSFETEIEERSTRRKIVREQSELLGNFIYDGNKSLYTFRSLQLQEQNIKFKTSEDVENVLKIEHKGKIDLSSPEALMVMNIIFRRTMSGMNLQLVGRNLYDPQRSIKLEEFNLELWPGFITSVRKHEDDMLICCEVSHRVMRKDTVYDVMREIMRRNNNNNWQDEFKREILGAVVLTDYNNRTYRIDDVDFKKNPTSKFSMKGEEKSFGKYYMEKYKRNIQDRGQPMLVSNPSKRDIRSGKTEAVLLIPELCRMTGLSEKMRSNFQMMRRLAEHTQLKPNLRVKTLENFSERIRTTEKCAEVLKGANISIDKNLVTIDGRQLNQEVIVFGRDKTYQNDERVDWTIRFRDNEMYRSEHLTKWCVIFPRDLSHPTHEFINLLKRVGKSMNYRIDDPLQQQIDRGHNDNYRDAIMSIVGKNPQLIFVVLSTNNAQSYTLVKTLTCVANSIPSQVVVGRTITPKNPKGLMSIATKVAVQINCKLGGSPWFIQFPLSGVMTVGFDVTHDTKDKSKSIGAFVATMDLKKEVKFFSGVIEHRGGEELSPNLSKMLGRAIEDYVKLHSVLPQRLMFYRDGVGDGQIEQVQQIELNEMKILLNQLRVKYNDSSALKLTFVIVNKRINTRIFLHHGNEHIDNPKSSTVVDKTITLPERYDFYLVSQCVRIGTVAPTLYNVIEDESGLTPGKLQTLTYKHCHLYYNWSGAVRVPAVVQYAHKLAFLVGQYLHAIPKEEFGAKGSLYFL